MIGMRAAFALISHHTHVAHVTFYMGDPLGIARKSGGLRKIECCRRLSMFSRPPGIGDDSSTLIFASFRSHPEFLVRTALVAIPASLNAHFAHHEDARGVVDQASDAIRVGHSHDRTCRRRPE
jgi:hypothetical protein